MYERPKGNFSFLVALSKQVQAALDTDRDDDVADYLHSLAHNLGVLISGGVDDADRDDSGLHESVDDVDAPGDDTPLGAALAKIAELEARASTMERTRLVGSPANASDTGGLELGSKRRQPALLKGRGGRRGKRS